MNKVREREMLKQKLKKKKKKKLSQLHLLIVCVCVLGILVYQHAGLLTHSLPPLDGRHLVLLKLSVKHDQLFRTEITQFILAVNNERFNVC